MNKNPFEKPQCVSAGFFGVAAMWLHGQPTSSNYWHEGEILSERETGKCLIAIE
jgi:hypothetical protein